MEKTTRAICIAIGSFNGIKVKVTETILVLHLQVILDIYVLVESESGMSIFIAL